MPTTVPIFDVTLCAQTLQFLNERPLALAEMYRVLKPGGHLALSLWRPIQEKPYFDALVAAVKRHVDPATAAGLGAAFFLTHAEGMLEKAKARL